MIEYFLLQASRKIQAQSISDVSKEVLTNSKIPGSRSDFSGVELNLTARKTNVWSVEVPHGHSSGLEGQVGGQGDVGGGEQAV